MRLIVIYYCTIISCLHKLRIGKSELELKINDENYNIEIRNVMQIFISNLKMYILFIYKYC